MSAVSMRLSILDNILIFDGKRASGSKGLIPSEVYT